MDAWELTWVLLGLYHLQADRALNPRAGSNLEQPRHETGIADLVAEGRNGDIPGGFEEHPWNAHLAIFSTSID